MTKPWHPRSGRPILLAALVGCAGAADVEQPLALDVAAPPPYAVAVTDMVAGERSTLTANTLAQGELAYFFASNRGEGSGPCVPGTSTCLDLLNPILVGAVPGDASGEAAFDFVVPTFFPDGMQAWFQVVVLDNGTYTTSDIATAFVSAGSLLETCALDALDDAAEPDLANEIWMLEDSGFSLFDLTLGGSDGGEPDAYDRITIPVADGCRVDLFPTTEDDTALVTAAYTLDDTLTTVPFGVVTTAANQTGDAQELDLGLFLADTDTCFTYDLLALYTCNQAPVVEAVALSVDGGDTCGTWSCDATATDPDGDALTLAYAWSVDGVDLGVDASTLDGSLVAADAAVTCTVTARDDLGNTAEGSASRVAVATPLTVDRVTVAGGRQGDPLTCQVATTSCDAPSLSYTWTVDGVDVGADGETLDTSGLAVGAEVACAVDATEGVLTASGASSAQALAPRTLTLVGSSGRVGYGVAVLPDIDGDGYGVLAAGAPAYSENLSYAGRLYLVDGALDTEVIDVASVEDGTYGTTFDGPNGDYDLERLACGTVFYVGGCPTDVAMQAYNGYDEGPSGAAFGADVRNGGDVDGDGLPDLLVAAPFEMVNDIWQGRTYAISGATLGSAQLADVTDATSLAGFAVQGECGRRKDEQDRIPFADERDILNGHLAGFSIAGVGDTNGDGLADLGVGAPNAGDGNRGMSYVVYGRDDGANVDLGAMYSVGCDTQGGSGVGVDAPELGVAMYGREDSGSNLGSSWGWTLGSAGDFDGDGYADTLFAGKNEVGLQILAGRPEGGVVDFVSSSVLPPEEGWNILTTRGILSFGYEDASVTAEGVFLYGSAANGGGDFNGDGLDDLVVPHLDFTFGGPFSVVFGTRTRGNLLVQSVQLGASESGGVSVLEGEGAVSTERSSAVIIGDLNGDGLDDAAAGQPFSNDVVVLYGRDDGVGQINYSSLRDGTDGFVLEGQRGDHFGWSLDGGDLDGDGLDDLVIGAPGNDDLDAGYVQVIFGRDMTGDIDWMGGTGDDTFTGTAGADSMVGGHGDDTLLGNGGADVLYGGAGDNVIEVSDLGFQRVRGGTGTDTLRFTASAGDVDMTTFDAFVDDIEILELSGQDLSVPTVELLNLSTLSNQLDVVGSGTLSTIPGDVWQQTGTVSEGDTTFLVLRNGRATLRVDTALDTDIPPSVTTSSVVVAENSGVGSVVGTIAANDPDGASVSFAIVGGPGASVFAIDPATGELTVLDEAALDYENDEVALDLRVAVTDAEALVTTVDISVTLTDVPEPPAFTVDLVEVGTEEGSGTDGAVIATVLATDEDAGDTFTYSLAGADAGLFAIDALGQITIAADATLDFETATQHTIDAVATDATGLTDTVTVAVEVYDADVIESSMTLSLSTTGRSLFVDGETAWEQSWGDDLMAWCVARVENEENGAQTLLSTSMMGSLAEQLGIPEVSLEFDFYGELCVGMAVSASDGDIDVSLPIDVNLAIPDEVEAGGTFAITTDWLVGDGGSVSGSQPGFDVDWRASASGVRWLLSYCFPEDNALGGVDERCADVFDVGPLSTSTDLAYDFGRVPWVADVTSADNTTWSLSSPTVDRLDEDFAVTPMMDQLILDMGLPTLGEGTVDVRATLFEEPLDLTIDYAVTNETIETTLAQRLDPVFRLDGVRGLITYENGDQELFDLGAGLSVLNMPAGADVDLDGDVDVTIELVPDASVATTYDKIYAVDFRFELMAGSAEAQLANSSTGYNRFDFGPLVDETCAEFTGAACTPTEQREVFDTQVTGWNNPVIRGAIDLAAPTAPVEVPFLVEATGDDWVELYLDGVFLGGSYIWEDVLREEGLLGAGDHVLAAQVFDSRIIGGLMAALTVDGTRILETGDGSWSVTATAPPATWADVGFDDSGWGGTTACSTSATNRWGGVVDLGTPAWVWDEANCNSGGNRWFRAEFTVE